MITKTQGTILMIIFMLLLASVVIYLTVLDIFLWWNGEFKL